MNVPVLMYHRVVARLPRAASSDFVVSRDTFRQHLRYLVERGLHTPTIAQALRTTDPLTAERSILLTFDDGYVDNYTEALPLLLEHKLRATFFVVADQRRRRNFWDVDTANSNARLMEAHQLRAMVSAGMEIGSHSVSHPRLALLDDDAALLELRDSRRILEDIIGAPVDSFAYPFGSLSPRVKGLVRRAGYRAAFAVNSGPFDFHADPFEIRRVLIADRAEEPYLFAKISGLEKAARTSSSFLKSLVPETMRTP
ncbi:MAG: polysaccharide deacetylase family protein [Deltaproteobacteria bacterium]|nr:polysaccharide deacetylase family protein [Deltaproteobacteria bacterium]